MSPKTTVDDKSNILLLKVLITLEINWCFFLLISPLVNVFREKYNPPLEKEHLVGAQDSISFDFRAEVGGNRQEKLMPWSERRKRTRRL